jgi:predicted Fe-Mo cluster-binding NifX family protein
MKIAVPVTNNTLCLHFGHCEKFVIVTVDDSTKTITGKKEVIPPPHEPGLLPKWLHGEHGVTVIIAGGMGSHAQQLFQEYNIAVITGAPAEHPQTVIMQWLDEKLITGSNGCDH